MSDLSRKSEHDDGLDAFSASHRSAVPAVADDAALDRVHAGARRRVRSRGRTSLVARPRLRVAGAVVAFALVVGAVAYALSPRVDDSAFARQQAVAALLPTGGIHHARATYTSSGRNDEFGADPVRRQVWEDWIDVERQETRGQVIELSDGKVAELSVRTGGRSRVYSASFKLDTEKHAYVRLRAEQLMEGPATDEITSPAGPVIDQMRAAIESGQAKVVDRITENGEDLWVVEWEVPADEGGEPTTVKATLRTDDYAPRHLEITARGKNGNGHWTGTDSWDWDVWETVDRSSLPADFFSLEAASELARPDTKIEVLPQP